MGRRSFNEILFDNNQQYGFRYKYKTADLSVYYCLDQEKSGCSARLLIDKKGNRSYQEEHNHDPDPEVQKMHIKPTRTYTNSKYASVLNVRDDGYTYCAICAHKYSQPLTPGSTTTSHYRYHLDRYHRDVFEKINSTDSQAEAFKDARRMLAESPSNVLNLLNGEMNEEDLEEPTTSSSFSLDEAQNLEKYFGERKEMPYGLEHEQILRLLQIVELNGDLLYKRKNGNYKRKYLKDKWFSKTAEILGVQAESVENAYKKLIRDLLAQRKNEAMFGNKGHLVSIVFPYYNEMNFILKTWADEKAERDLETSIDGNSSEPKEKRPFTLLENEDFEREVELRTQMLHLMTKPPPFVADSPSFPPVSDHSELLSTLLSTQMTTLEILNHLKTQKSQTITENDGYKEIIEKIEGKLVGKSTLQRFSLILKVAQFIDSL